MELTMSTIANPASGRAVLPASIDGSEPLTDAERANPEELSVANLTALAWDGDGYFRYGRHVEDISHDNTRRAGFALDALQAYADCTGGLASEPVEAKLTDLLGDLKHLADALGVDFSYLAGQAARHYDPETRGEF
jgi:hypothetical protein